MTMKPRYPLRPRHFILPALLLAALLLGGCVTTPVPPWERGALTEYGMQPERDPLLTAANEHIWFSREASTGGRGVGGSGCGCN